MAKCVNIFPWHGDFMACVPGVRLIPRRPKRIFYEWILEGIHLERVRISE